MTPPAPSATPAVVHVRSHLGARLWLIGWGLGLTLLAAMLASVCIGVSAVSATGIQTFDPGVVLREIFKALGLISTHPRDDAALTIQIIDLRLPVTITAALTGAALATAGAMTQGIFRNPLAAPSIIGVEAGASLGGAFALYGLRVGPLMLPGLSALVAPIFAQPLGAFIGAFAAAFMVYALATRQRHTHLPTLLLAGVAVSSLAAALTSMIIASATQQMIEVRKLYMTQMGGFEYVLWSDVAMLVPGTVLGIAGGLLMSRELNLLTLGERNAAALGVNLQRVKLVVLACAALSAGSAISVVGMIGFVGLVVPHLVRFWTGPDHRVLLPACALGGAVFMVVMDLAQRIVCVGWWRTPELRIGVWMGVIGGAFFVYLLLTQRHLSTPG